MNDGFKGDVLLSSFPDSLAVDAEKYALARVIAEELQTLLGDCDKLRIYSRIDELGEDMLDILAFDFAVSWYYYDGSIEIKRAQIKSCFYVHRHLGTKASLERALSDICPGSIVEEWFEYGGAPYYFRVIIDVTDQRLPIIQSDVERYINIFKSLRSVLEEKSVIYRSRGAVNVGLEFEYVVFRSPSSASENKTRAGIYPENTMLSANALGGDY